jgi:hypothetical protein
MREYPHEGEMRGLKRLIPDKILKEGIHAKHRDRGCSHGHHRFDAIPRRCRRGSRRTAHRSYPRVVKRTQIGDKLVKRAHHREILHTGSVKIEIRQAVA